MKVVQAFGKGAAASAVRLSLFDINTEMTDAWKDNFFGMEAVEICKATCSTPTIMASTPTA